MRRAPQSPVLQCWNVDRRNCPPWLRRKRRLRQSFDIDVEERGAGSCMTISGTVRRPAIHKWHAWSTPSARLPAGPPGETHPLIPELPPRQCGSGKATPQPFLSRPALALLADMADTRATSNARCAGGVMGSSDTLRGRWDLPGRRWSRSVAVSSWPVPRSNPWVQADQRLRSSWDCSSIGGQWMARESEQFKVVSAEIQGRNRHREDFPAAPFRRTPGQSPQLAEHGATTYQVVAGTESSPGTHRHTGRHRTSAGHWHREVDVGSRSAAADRSGRDAASGCLGPSTRSVRTCGIAGISSPVRSHAGSAVAMAPV